MVLSKESWLPVAEGLCLEEGRSARTDHDCGPGRTLFISREPGFIRAFCYRCNEGGHHHVVEGIDERIRRLANGAVADKAAQKSITPPAGTYRWEDWPSNARLWLVKAGLSSADAGRLGAYYSREMERVILPCGGNFWQARSIDGRLPKYLAPVADKVHPRYGNANRVTLTEDILSAYKVGKAGGEGWCMLGTLLPPILLADILRRRCHVNIWLDDDAGAINRGQVAARKIMRQFTALGIDHRNIVTPKDPKLIPLHRIKELI